MVGIRDFRAYDPIIPGILQGNSRHVVQAPSAVLFAGEVTLSQCVYQYCRSQSGLLPSCSHHPPPSVTVLSLAPLGHGRIKSLAPPRQARLQGLHGIFMTTMGKRWPKKKIILGLRQPIGSVLLLLQTDKWWTFNKRLYWPVIKCEGLKIESLHLGGVRGGGGSNDIRMFICTQIQSAFPIYKHGLIPKDMRVW